MNQNLTCKKVTAMLALYIDDKLDVDMKIFVKAHIEVCDDCFEKFSLLKKLILELRQSYDNVLHDDFNSQSNRQFDIREYQNFHSNLSAYFDNELPLEKSVNMKKYMIKFPNSRVYLEEMYNLRKLVISSSECVKKNLREDYSKSICSKVQGKKLTTKKELALRVASFAVVLVLLGTLIGAISPVGKMVKEKGSKFFKKTIYVNSQVETDFLPN